MPSNRALQPLFRLRHALRQRSFDNRTFWNARYTKNPSLGSGVSSRGEVLEYKRGLLRDALSGGDIRSVLDIGCGDMELSSFLPSDGYTGVDVSEVVIERNRERFPDRRFVAGSLLDIDLEPADLVIMFDVLIHINSRETYDAMVRRAVSLTAKRGLIGAYDVMPKLSGITFFHEPVSATIHASGGRSVQKVGQYGETSVISYGPAAG